MQHNGGRVQFPEQLPAAEISRPPSARSLLRVGSNPKVPLASRPSNYPNEAFERTRTPSVGSTSRPDNLGLGHPSRSPVQLQGLSPLNPSRRRGSGQHIHRRKDSTEHYDPSKYDLDNAFYHPASEDDSHLVAPEHHDGIAKIIQKRRRRAEASRNATQAEIVASPADILFNKQKAQHTSRSLPQTFDSTTLVPTSSLGESSSRVVPELLVANIRSDSPSSQENSGRSQEHIYRADSSASNSEKRGTQDVNWPNVFKKHSADKSKKRSPLSADEMAVLEQEMEDRMSRVKATASPGSFERAITTADQLRRRYALVFTSLVPGKDPFNLMDVIRWRRKQFEESITLPSAVPPSREDERERQSLSWRPHLSDLHDPQSSRYRSRAYASWHLTALLMEQYVESLRPQPSMEPQSDDFHLLASGSGQNLQLTPEHAHTVTSEYDSNQSAMEQQSRGLNNSLRRLRRSLPGASKSIDWSPRQSSHQAKGSISSLQLFGNSRPTSPNNSRTHLKKRVASISPSKLGEHSDEGELSGQGSLSAQERSGHLSTGSLKPEYLARSSSPEKEREQLVVPSSEEDRSRRSSEEGAFERISKKRMLRPFFSREETAVPINKATRGHVPNLSHISELDLMPPLPDPQKRFKLQASLPRSQSRSREARVERQKGREEKGLDAVYEEREAELRELDELIKNMNQGQYQLLQVGREYLREATRLKQVFSLEEFQLPTEEDLRILAEPTSRSHARYEGMSRDPEFVQRQNLSEQQAKCLHDDIFGSQFAPPAIPELYSATEDNLEADYRKLEVIGRDLDYVKRVAEIHAEKGAQFNVALASLRTELGKAFAHTSQVYRDVLTLETLVAASRPVPTWKRISNRVKPILSWGVTALTLILKFLGEIGRIFSFMLPSFIKNLFGWEMLSGAWPRFVFALHFIVLLIIRRMMGWYWSFEEGIVGAISVVPLAYVFSIVYWSSGWYNRELRYYLIADWWESNQRSRTWSEWFSRHWYAILLVIGGFLPLGLLYLFRLYTM